ncbi:hypothetical protein INT48_002118 [Thamnidium elegans]|uniref:Fanconi anaemia group A protein helical domain-containing protein n=1 Tax=Thamnidium elegans TaxID=101142 RepID=A0A8H7W051_9FUNG|nr:hypothetical protein INT48_002118 [Thamnidium elegans]
MPKIPVTREIFLKRLDQDNIQWTLTNYHEKIEHCNVHVPSDVTLTTIDIAKKFIKLMNNTNNKQAKIDEIVKDIKRLYNTVSFSTRMFIDYVIEQVSNMTSLLITYYEVSVQLDVLALSTRALLTHIPQIDELLCELFYYQDKVGEAYIQALDEKTLNEIFVQDGKQFLNWSGLMKEENIRRLLCILKYYTKTMKKDQCLNLLLRLQTITTEDVNKRYLGLIERAKEFIFVPNKMSTKQSDTFIIKAPVLQFLSTWFSEFEYDSTLKLSEFTLNVIFSSTESNEHAFDISLLLYIYNIGCKQLSLDGKDVTQINDIIEILNSASTKSLEQDSSGALAAILTFAQFTFEQMHEAIGYTYPSWFQKLNTVFINIMQQLIPYELASVLQIHGKALHGCFNIPNADVYVSAVKKRLLELGVDSMFKKYPQSMKIPVQSSTVIIEDDISNILSQFMLRGEAVPHSLLSASVFRRAWFISTFLPKLFSWDNQSEIKARDKLIEALRKDKKIPDAMYHDFVQKKK